MGPKPFEFDIDSGSNAIKWEVWLNAFEIYADASGVYVEGVKRSWLLHCAGQKVQQIFRNLPRQEEIQTEDAPPPFGPLATGYVPLTARPYTEAVEKLNAFFTASKSPTFEKHVFRQMKRNENEHIEMYAIRLRTQAERCDFGEQIEKSIIDQIIESGNVDRKTRKKLLRDGYKLNLSEVITMIRVQEATTKQLQTIARDNNWKSDQPETERARSTEKEEKTAEETSTGEQVCKISSKRFTNSKFGPNQQTNFSQNVECGRCGLRGHKSADMQCPAKGKTCNKCLGRDHFARKCLRQSNAKRTRNVMQGSSRDYKYENKRGRENTPVHMVESPGSKHYDYDDVFALDGALDFDSPIAANEIWCEVGGVGTKATIDSGSKYNIVDRKKWLEFKSNNIETVSRAKGSDKLFRAYGGLILKTLGEFEASIKIANKQIVAKF